MYFDTKLFCLFIIHLEDSKIPLNMTVLLIQPYIKMQRGRTSAKAVSSLLTFDNQCPKPVVSVQFSLMK